MGCSFILVWPKSFLVIIRAWHWSNQKVSILLWSPRQIGWGFVLLFSTSLHNEMLCFHEQALIQTARLCDRIPHPSLCLQAGRNLTHPGLKDVSSRVCFKISSIFSIVWLNVHSFCPCCLILISDGNSSSSLLIVERSSRPSYIFPAKCVYSFYNAPQMLVWPHIFLMSKEES